MGDTVKDLIGRLEENVTEYNMASKLQEVAEILRDPKTKLYQAQVMRVADIVEAVAWLMFQK